MIFMNTEGEFQPVAILKTMCRDRPVEARPQHVLLELDINFSYYFTDF